ncbi:MAG TPA: helix-turn-helix transcriptional regulator [Alphaproteobacteria bacterium]|nr:helix-turn-helix transcriptional regulator [Alphaproteobacteria bacterium]
MVKFAEAHLDRIFSALSDATRRGMLARLSSEESLSVSELAAPLDMTLPAVMKHLDVLLGAGLIKRSKSGRTVECTFNVGPMEQATKWLTKYQKFWTERFDHLTVFLESNAWPQSPASPSSGISKPRRKRSMPRGRTRKS